MSGRDILAAAIAEQRGEAPSEEEVDELLRVGRHAPRPRTDRERDRAAAKARGRRLVARLAPKAVVREHDKGRIEAPFGSAPTERELVMFAEYLIHGDIAAAAECVGLAENTMKNHMTNLYARLGTVSAVQTVVALGWAAWPRSLGVKYHVVATPDIPDVPTFKELIAKGVIR